MSRCRDHELIGKPLPCGCPPGCCPCKAQHEAAIKRIEAFFETEEGKLFAKRFDQYQDPGRIANASGSAAEPDCG
jgi:hypothetical protein